MAEEAAADRSCHLPPASWLLSQPKCDPCAPCVFVFLYLYSRVRAFVSLNLCAQKSATCVPPAVQVRLSVTHVLDGLIVVQCRRWCSTSSKCCSAACAFEVLYLCLCIFSILIIHGLIHSLCNTANCSQSLQVLIVEEALAAASCFQPVTCQCICISVFSYP